MQERTVRKAMSSGGRGAGKMHLFVSLTIAESPQIRKFLVVQPSYKLQLWLSLEISFKTTLK